MPTKIKIIIIIPILILSTIFLYNLGNYIGSNIINKNTYIEKR